MADTKLSDDMIKLVEYTIVDTGRDREGVLFGPHQVTETKNRTAESFRAAKIARFFEDLPAINRSRARRNQPELEPDEDDLEVFYQVLERWPRQSRRFRKRKLDRLAEVRDAIRELRQVAEANEAARAEPAQVSESPPVVAPAKKEKKKAARKKPRKAKKKRATRKKTNRSKPPAAGPAAKKKASKPRLRVPGATPEPPKE